MYSVLRARVSTRLNGRGVGKTRLLDECAASAEALGICTLCASCRDLARDYPFSIIHALFDATIVPADAAMYGRLFRARPRRSPITGSSR